MCWRASGKGPSAGFLAMLLEFQSRSDPDMALRLIAYALGLRTGIWKRKAS